MSRVNETWMEFISRIPFEHKHRHIASVQRMYHDLQWQYDGDWDLELEETGYTPVKLTQLKTYYLPSENLIRAIDMLDRRMENNKYGSVLIPHQGRLKSGFTQNDWCLIGTTLTFYPKERGIKWVTHVRSTEAIKRARGDMVLFAYMLEELAPLTEQAGIIDFTMKYDTLTFHPMMVPLMFPHIKWRTWMDALREHDERLWQDIVKWLVYYFHNPEKTYERYSSAHQVHKICHSQMTKKRIKSIRNYARDHWNGGPRG